MNEIVLKFRKWGLSPICLSGLMLLASAWLTPAAYAAGPYGTAQCAASRFGSNLGCTANDVSINSITVAGSAPASCIGGQTIPLNLNVTVNFASPNRYNVGVFISNDGNNPKLLLASGGAASCSVGVLPTTSPFLNLDSNTCGDGNGSISSGTGSGTFLMSNVAVPCTTDGSGNTILYIPYLISWDQSSGTPTSCLDNTYPVPGTTSKCNTGSVNFPPGTSIVVLPALTITDGVTSTTAGSALTYTVVITNTTGSPLNGAVFKVPAVTDLSVSTVTCAAAGGATCPVTGVAAMQGAGITLPNMPTNSSVTFTLSTTLAAAATGTLTNTASVTYSGQTNAAGDTDTIDIPAVDHFGINIGSASASTCSAKTIIITARDASNATVSSFTGTVNITASPAHGDWSKVTASGTLTAGAADSGVASYQFVAADNGVVTLALTNHHADNSLSVTVVDSSLPSSSSTSAAMSFSDNAFVITNDPIQVAGRPQAMSVAMWRKDPSTGLCAISPYYTGAKNLKAWLSRDGDDPSGAAPVIGALSLPNALPGANNLALTFSAGSASFNLGTSDVGKYVLNLRDDSHIFATGVDINGSTGTITTRPFALVVSAVKQGGVNNPANSGPGGAVFAKAGSSFQATVGAYLWNSAADTNVAGGDGVPDAAATLATITGAGATPSYRWPTTLAAGIPYTPATALDTPAGAGVAGTFSSSTLSGACPAGSPNCFTNGVAIPTNLSYSEVGSFTLSGAASNFLNSGIALSARVFDNTGALNGVVGRFVPDHFDTVVSGGMPCPTGLTCPTTFNGFVYSGQTFTTNVIAQNLAGATTMNYDNGLGFSKAVTLSAWNALGSTLTQNPGSGVLSGNAVPANVFVLGIAATSTPAYALPNPYPSTTPSDPIDIYMRALDTDSVTSLRAVSANSVEGGIKIVSGRIKVPNAHGSELLKLPLSVTVQYWNGTRWVTSATDSVTTFAAGNVLFTNCQNNLSTGGVLPNNCKPAVAVDAATSPVVVTNGSGSFRLSAPGINNNGSADVTINAPGYLPSTPARVTFGIFKGATEHIYIRENY